PPPKQTPEPLRPATTPPTAGVVGDPPVHASAMFEEPAVATNDTDKLVPGTVAVTATLPAADPKVAVVFAWPLASVVVDAGFTLAAPDVTAKLTDAPETADPLAVTFTVSGTDSDVPTSPTCPSPETMAMAEGVLFEGPDVSPEPPHAATNATRA